MKTTPKKIGAVVGIYINNRIFIALTVFLLCFMAGIATALRSNIINFIYTKSIDFVLIRD
jgi:hypothetical protein